MTSNITVTGSQINYYNVCHRKLWLFSHQITMEHTSDNVKIGSLIHETSYKKKKKEIQLDGIKIDFYDKNNGVIHEVKKSKAIDTAHHWQLKYYIWYFKQLGIDVSGSVDYPVLRRREKVTLSEEDNIQIIQMLDDIEHIILKETPPDVIHAKFCKKCSYYELCYI